MAFEVKHYGNIWNEKGKSKTYKLGNDGMIVAEKGSDKLFIQETGKGELIVNRMTADEIDEINAIKKKYGRDIQLSKLKL